MSDGRHFDLEVVSGKDTTGEHDAGKHRETWIPIDVESTINRYIQQEGIARDEPLIDRTKRTVQYWIEKTRRAATEETGDTDYKRLSTHDLRRCWGNHLLVEWTYHRASVWRSGVGKVTMRSNRISPRRRRRTSSGR